MQQDSREKAKRAWILVLAAMASFMVSLDALVVATAVLATCAVSRTMRSPTQSARIRGTF